MGFVRKNAAPATVADITRAITEYEQRAADRSIKRGELEQLAEENLLEPAAQAKIHSDLGALEMTERFEREALARLAVALEETKARETRADAEQRKAAQIRASTKLANSLERRWNAVTGPLVALLQELEQDADACRRLNADLSEMGITGVDSAEVTARREYRIARPWDSFGLRETAIPAFTGGDLWNTDRGGIPL